MLNTIVNVFKIRELRNKILFTLGMLAVFRIGHWIPLPGINQEEMRKQFEKASGSAFAQIADYIAIFSGGTLSHSTIFGLGIMPYITASIIFQLLAGAVPAIKKLQDEGPTGRQKVMEWTRYATVGLCIFQSMWWLGFIKSSGLVYPAWAANPVWWVMAVSALTAGTIFLMWIGEQIDKHGIGNGVSMLIMAGILARMPDAALDVGRKFDPAARDPGSIGWLGLLMLLAMFVTVIAGSVLMTVAQRRIPIQQAKHTRGRRVFGGQRSYLPLRVNHGGVMPIVFASSLMIFPTALFTQLADSARSHARAAGGEGGWWVQVTQWLSNNFAHGEFPYVLLYITMVYVFSYFWITVQFNPQEMSKQLKEHGSFIPGLRPGPRTAEYLETVMSRITYVGAAFLAVIAVMPEIVHKSMNIPYSITQFLGGTGTLIVVSVCLDFLQRVEANLLMRNYAGFLSEGGDAKGPRLQSPRSM